MGVVANGHAVLSMHACKTEQKYKRTHVIEHDNVMQATPLKADQSTWILAKKALHTQTIRKNHTSSTIGTSRICRSITGWYA